MKIDASLARKAVRESCSFLGSGDYGAPVRERFCNVQTRSYRFVQEFESITYQNVVLKTCQFHYFLCYPRLDDVQVYFTHVDLEDEGELVV